ncbi:S1 RNA-binding domain-containing protein [Pseudomonas sp. BW7P1]|uniref:S1 RNA-binding domain-containing protein n=1 Tax=Pseudomonas TaxID=286 RepID=UPI0021AD5FDB|nr:S1 RNA-binding domain-containing protein [Pseudomonas sp. BW7P1]UWI64161.1 S1 RNA-binding domain-containing protein [Pseudomonas sp. BW7P1]
MSLQVEGASELLWNVARLLVRINYFDEERQKEFDKVLIPFLAFVGKKEKCNGTFVSSEVVGGLKSQGSDSLCHRELDFKDESASVSPHRKELLQDFAALTGGQVIAEGNEGEAQWNDIKKRYPIGTRVMARVTNMSHLGAFVEVEAGIDGLMLVSEINWPNENNPPSEGLSPGDEVEVEILGVDEQRRSISLGIR